MVDVLLGHQSETELALAALAEDTMEHHGTAFFLDTHHLIAFLSTLSAFLRMTLKLFFVLASTGVAYVDIFKHGASLSHEIHLSALNGEKRTMQYREFVRRAFQEGGAYHLVIGVAQLNLRIVLFDFILGNRALFGRTTALALGKVYISVGFTGYLCHVYVGVYFLESYVVDGFRGAEVNDLVWLVDFLHFATHPCL